jgi:hypothetical protein
MTMTGPNDKKTRDLTKDDEQADEDLPEFQGLFERRSVNHRGIPLVEYSYGHQNGDEMDRPSSTRSGKTFESEEDTSDIDAFLEDLDNSAIRLADSGIFKIDDDD